MKSNWLKICILAVWMGQMALAGIAFAQTSPSAQSASTLNAPFSVRNAFYNKYGTPWAAASEEQRAQFLKKISVAGIPYTSSAVGSLYGTPQPSQTLKVPFSIQNAYFNQYGVAWGAATEQQRIDYLKQLQKTEKQRQRDIKTYYKQRQATAKRISSQSKEVEKRRKARLKAEEKRKKEEMKKQKNAIKQRNVLKRKMRHK